MPGHEGRVARTLVAAASPSRCPATDCPPIRAAPAFRSRLALSVDIALPQSCDNPPAPRGGRGELAEFMQSKSFRYDILRYDRKTPGRGADITG